MSLQELVQSHEKLTDSLLVLKLTNGFHVAVEKFEGGRIHFDDFQGGDSSVGPWSMTHGDPAKNFSQGANAILRDYAGNQLDPFTPIKSEIAELYDSILEPIKIEPIMKRAYGSLLMNLGLSFWPISIPAVGVYLLGKKATGTLRYGDQNWLMAAIAAPHYVKLTWPNVKNPYVAAVRISNPEVLETNPEAENKVAIRLYSNFDPNNFGSHSSLEARKANLHIVFPDGRQLEEGSIWRPHAKDLYHECKYFLAVKKGTFEKMHALDQKQEAFHNNAREFNKLLTPENVYATCRKVGFLQ